MPYPRRHLIVLKSLEPIAHGDTVTGIDNSTNTRIFMRSAQFVNGRAMRIPDVSENALRSVLFRRPLHDHLVHNLDIAGGNLCQTVMNLLFSGGNVASGAKSPSNEMELGHGVRRLYPSLELLGGAVDDFILPRSRLRLAAWPVTREYAPFIAYISSILAEEAEKISIWDLLFEETRTRGTGDESEGNQMLYSYETLAAGTRILVELTLDAHTSEAVESALSVALGNWDGYFGGQGRQGRGRMEIEPEFSMVPDKTDYLKHLEIHGKKMAAGLLDGTLGQKRILCRA